MTGQNVIDRAYDMVGDVGINKRNSASEMANFLNDGVRDLIARRPYLRLQDDGTQAAAYTDLHAGNLSASLPFSEEWIREALAHYIAARIFLIDAEDENNLRQSQQHMAQYQRRT